MKQMIIRKEGNDYEVDFLDRTIGERGAQVKLAKVTMLIDMTQEWVIREAAKMTFIRFQDNTRRTCNAAEVADLDGTVLDAGQFWDERATKKDRKPVAMNPAKATAAISKMTEADQEQTLKILASDPKFSEMLKGLFK